jgi:ATP-binding cassette subfamily C protein
MRQPAGQLQDSGEIDRTSHEKSDTWNFKSKSFLTQSPNLQEAQSNRTRAAEIDPLTAWRLSCRRTLTSVAVFSTFVNLMMLTIPLYLFQLSDRVLTSRSLDTLLMLSLVALGFIVVLSLLDIIRRQVLGRLATRFETMLGGPVLAGVVTSAKIADSANVQVLRNLHHVKSFISSPVMLLLFDVPLAPIYFGAVFLIHPALGFISLVSGLVLIAIALINQKATNSLLATPVSRASA